MSFQEIIVLLAVWFVVSVPVIVLIGKKMNSTCKPDVIALDGTEFNSVENEDKIPA